MKDKRIATILSILIIVMTGGILFSIKDRFTFYKQKPVEKQVKEIHYHAGFRIYIDGELQDFAKLEYMSLVPCAVDHEEEEPAHEEEAELLHLHDTVGDVVHIHGPDRKWKHVFEYLKLSPSQPLSAYNGTTRIENPLESPVKAYQSMTFFIGQEPTNRAEIYAAPISKSYIQEIEKRSETCATP